MLNLFKVGPKMNFTSFICTINQSEASVTKLRMTFLSFVELAKQSLYFTLKIKRVLVRLQKKKKKLNIRMYGEKDRTRKNKTKRDKNYY